ncbi:hypothetical protein IGI96_002992 [Enterococcus sp. DIV0421]|uniref:TcpE family conjugal transfer membrane protein n=1 Tax=Enterococcus sp. DIV0421 TaxID=2774688 RepID=UPI003F25CF3E
MEYNYTKEWKQPHKVYKIGAFNLSRFFPAGLKLSYVVTTTVFIVLFGIVALITAIKGIAFISSLFSKSWFIIIFFIILFSWILFSMTWDNKNAYRYLVSQIRYGKTKEVKIEHEDLVVYDQFIITYQKGGKRK